MSIVTNVVTWDIVLLNSNVYILLNVIAKLTLIVTILTESAMSLLLMILTHVHTAVALSVLEVSILLKISCFVILFLLTGCIDNANCPDGYECDTGSHVCVAGVCEDHPDCDGYDEVCDADHSNCFFCGGDCGSSDGCCEGIERTKKRIH